MCSGLCVKSFVAHKLQSTTQLSHCEMDVVSQPHKGHAMASPNVKQLVGCPSRACKARGEHDLQQSRQCKGRRVSLLCTEGMQPQENA